MAQAGHAGCMLRREWLWAICVSNVGGFGHASLDKRVNVRGTATMCDLDQRYELKTSLSQPQAQCTVSFQNKTCMFSHHMP